jgi:hypothetical protein
MEGLELDLPVADPHAEVEAPAAEDRQGRRVLGESDRIVDR